MGDPLSFCAVYVDLECCTDVDCCEEGSTEGENETTGHREEQGRVALKVRSNK